VCTPGDPTCQTDDSDDATCTCGEKNNFKCYRAKYQPGTDRLPFGTQVSLSDQFRSTTARILRPDQICNPVDKNGEGIEDPHAHLLCYKIIDRARRTRFLANVTDQFGTEELQSSDNGRLLCVPALKNPDDCNPDLETCPSLSDIQSTLNHYQCYDGRRVAGTSTDFPAFPFSVNLKDQFFPNGTTTAINKTLDLCNPTEKSFDDSPTPIVDPSAHLKCYDITDDTRNPGERITVVDQFGTWQMQAGKATRLCEPATKELLEGRPTPP
jgi:hypothetical protein